MVQITEVNREPATTVSTLTATTEVTSPSVTADSASVTNAVDAGSVTTDTLEAEDSFTDPAGNTYTGRVGKTTEQVQEDAIIWSDGYAPNFAGGN